MSKPILKILPVFCGALAVFGFAALPSASLFENNDVKVTRALEKAHVKGSFHEHKVNRVMVYLQDGRQRFEYQDGRAPAVFEWKAGQVVWSVPEGMHSPEVVSDDAFNIVEIELKKPGVAVVALKKPSAKYFKVEFENNQVRVLRLKLGPHQSTPAMTRDHGAVAVYLTDQESTPHKAGDAVWETPGNWKVENAGGKPLEMILVELRN